MRIGFFVWEYPHRLVTGLGTYANYITREFAELRHDVSVFMLNSRELKTEEDREGLEAHRPAIANTYSVFPMLVTDNLKKRVVVPSRN